MLKNTTCLVMNSVKMSGRAADVDTLVADAGKLRQVITSPKEEFTAKASNEDAPELMHEISTWAGLDIVEIMSSYYFWPEMRETRQSAGVCMMLTDGTGFSTPVRT